MVHEDILKYFIPLTENEIAARDKIKTKEDSDELYTFKIERMFKPGETVTYARNPRYSLVNKHTHDYIELVYMISGTTTHHIDGDIVVMNPGDILILSPYTKHSIETAMRDEDIAVNFLIIPEFLDKTFAMLGEEPSPLMNFFSLCFKGESEDNEYIHFKVGNKPQIQSLMEVFLWNLVYNIPYKNKVNENLMGLIMLLLQDVSEYHFKNSKSMVVWSVLRYIDNNYQNCNLKKCAESLGYDYCSLSNKIRRETGKSFTALLQEKRLSQASYLLRSTNLSILEISNSVGYENEGFFYKIFGDKFGIKPYDYRKKYN